MRRNNGFRRLRGDCGGSWGFMNGNGWFGVFGDVMDGKWEVGLCLVQRGEMHGYEKMRLLKGQYD